MENSFREYFTIKNKIAELPVLAEKIEQLAEKWKFPGSVAMNINLALEEALTNIIYYAFNDNKTHKIEISIYNENNSLIIEIKDDGIPFDPTGQKMPDISQPAEERPVGGLGILLILKIMDNVRYSRKNDLNILTLTKHIVWE